MLLQLKLPVNARRGQKPHHRRQQGRLILTEKLRLRLCQVVVRIIHSKIQDDIKHAWHHRLLLPHALVAPLLHPLAFSRVLFAAPSALFFVVAGIVASLPSRAISSQWRRQLDCHWSRGSSLGEEIVISFHGAPRVAMGGDVMQAAELVSFLVMSLTNVNKIHLPLN
jgi:hypothetical protein